MTPLFIPHQAFPNILNVLFLHIYSEVECINLRTQVYRLASSYIRRLRTVVIDVVSLCFDACTAHTAKPCNILLRLSLARFFYEEYYKDDIVNLGGFGPGFECHSGTL